MKVEFLAEGAAACPLVRLFGYQTAEIERLYEACGELAEGKRVGFALHDEPWVESIRGCRFTWQAGSQDAGVPLPPCGESFVLILSDEGWREVQDKLQSFIRGDRGYCWLTNAGEVNVLVSSDGAW